MSESRLQSSSSSSSSTSPAAENEDGPSMLNTRPSMVLDPLMTSLGKPRKSFSKSAYNHGASGTMVKAADGRPVSSSQLPLLRIDDASELARASKAELEEVRSLTHEVKETGASLQRMGGVEAMESRRKQRHDDAVREFEVQQRALYARLEDAVIHHGRTLRESIADIDRRQDAAFAHANDPSSGVGQDLRWLASQLRGMEGLEEERKGAIHAFAAGLDSVEQERAGVLGARLASLTKELVGISYELEAGVSRITEKISTDLNVVAASNRRDAADVLARLEKSAVAARKRMLQRWAETERAWRSLKHKDAVERFQKLLDSPTYTNPPRRVAAFGAIAEASTQRHLRRRLPLVETLASLRPPQLTSSAVAAIKKELEAMEADEKADNADGLQRVRAAQDDSLSEARESLEVLRLELHAYEAMAPGGRLASLGEELEDAINDPSLEDFFRRVNGLRVELVSLVAAAHAPDTIYEGPLSALKTRASLLVEAMAVGPALVAAGKAMERAALLTILDAMRTAKRTELPGMVVKMHKLIASTLRVPGLPAIVVAEFEALLEALGDLLEEIHDALVAGGVEVPAPVMRFLFPEAKAGGTVAGFGSATGAGSLYGGSDGMSSMGRGSAAGGRTVGYGGGGGATARSGSFSPRPRKTGGAGRSHSMGSSGGHSQGSRGSRGSRNSKSSRRTKRTAGMKSIHVSIASEMTDPMSSVMGQVLPLAAIRGLQRRIAVVSAASDLPPDVQSILTRLSSACTTQFAANVAVDEVCEKEALPCIMRREVEAQGLIERAATAIDMQSLRFREAGEKLCAHSREVARAVASHSRAEVAADDFISEELNGALDQYEEKHADLEAEYARLTKLAREASTLAALEERNVAALKALDAIEAHYREYTETVLKWTKVHPQRVGAALRVHRKALGSLFGVVFDAAKEVDGEPFAGEGMRPGLRWTVDGPVPAVAGEEEEAPRAASSPKPNPTSPNAKKTTTARPTSGFGMSSRSPSKAAATKAKPKLVASAAAGGDDEEDDDEDPSIIEPLRALADEGVLEACMRNSASEAPSTAATSSSHLTIAAAAPISITYSSGGDLTALNLGSTIVPSPTPSGPAIYNVILPPLAFAKYFADGAGLLKIAETARKEKLEADAAAKVATAAAEAAAAAAAAPPPDPKAKAPAPAKKSKAELEAEAKAAEEAAAAAAAAEAARVAAAAAAAAAAEAEAAALAALSVAFPFGLTDAKTGVPLDPAGNPAVAHLVIPEEEIEAALASLRDHLFSQFEQYSAERRRIMSELATSRAAAFTAELEERLRRHWPRRGVLEVSVRTVREREVIDHRMRVEKHVLRVQEKEAEHAKSFVEWVAAQHGAIEGTLTKIDAMEASLPAQVNLAALQGVSQRCRQLRAIYTAACEASVASTRSRVTVETGRLVSAGEEFIAACKYFSDGGDHDPEEVALFSDDVNALASILKSAAAEREKEAVKVGEEQRASYSRFDTFNTAFDKALKELSMREGLGPKYGAPRRTAGGIIRTAIAKSEEAANLADARLEELRALLSAQPGGYVGETIPAPHPQKHKEEELEILRASKGMPPAAAAAEAPAAVAETSGGKPGTAAGGAKGGAPAPTPAPASSKPGTAAGGAKPAAASTAAPSAAAGMTPEAIAAVEAAKARELDEDMLGAQGAAPLAVRLRRCIIELRDLLYARAIHLQAFKTAPDLHGPLRTFHLPFLSCADVPPGCIVTGVGELATSSVTLPFVHVPAAYPPVHAKEALVLPPGSAPAPGTPSPSPLFATEAWLALNGLGQTSAPHAVKGVSPSLALQTAKAAPPFMTILSNALEACKADTRAVYLEEGSKLPDGDASLPESLRRWIGEQASKGAELREFSHRRLRDQVDLLATLLPLVPAVLAADVTARSFHEAGSDNGKRIRMYKVKAGALEGVRSHHIDDLRLELADPNKANVLEELASREAHRISELRDVISTSRASAVGGRARHARVFAARLAQHTALFMLAAEECVVREDLAPLPGDEFVVPKKLGFKRLHKTMRRAGDETHAVAEVALGHEEDGEEGVVEGTGAGGAAAAAAAAAGSKPPTAGAAAGTKPPASAAGGKAGAAAAPAPTPAASSGVLDGSRAARDVFSQRDWPGIPHPDLMFLLGPDEAQGLTLLHPEEEAQKAANAALLASTAALAPAPAAAAGVAKTPRAGTAAAAAAPAAAVSAPSAQATHPPADFAAVTCSYTSWGRHAIAERDRAYEEYANAFRASVVSLTARFDVALEEVTKWEAVWNAKVEALKESNSASGGPSAPGYNGGAGRATTVGTAARPGTVNSIAMSGVHPGEEGELGGGLGGAAAAAIHGTGASSLPASSAPPSRAGKK